MSLREFAENRSRNSARQRRHSSSLSLSSSSSHSSSSGSSESSSSERRKNREKRKRKRSSDKRERHSDVSRKRGKKSTKVKDEYRKKKRRRVSDSESSSSSESDSTDHKSKSKKKTKRKHKKERRKNKKEKRTKKYKINKEKKKAKEIIQNETVVDRETAKQQNEDEPDHVIPLRNVLLFKYLHMKESTPKSTITWSEMDTTNNKDVGPPPQNTEPHPKKRSMAPMTREEYEKQQSKIRRVYDAETGRHRLIKGDGEVIEEIVSQERHKVINKMATLGDGLSFQANLKNKKFT